MPDGTAIAPPARARGRTLLVADLFCGAGGFSTGAVRALARLGHKAVLTCVNHWPIAIETHSRNHPEARHYCQDLATVRPAAVVPEGRLDLLMASPTCTFHSRARGGKPTSDQQRMDPWHVVTWLTELRVRCFIFENVPEFVRWGPVDTRTGRPLKSREGEYFQAWWRTVLGLGFAGEFATINCADHGDATTRERWFAIGRSDGRRLRWPRPTHARRSGDGAATLFGPALPPWRAAREIIDWSIEGRSIFDRKKPLAPKTLKRIEAGMRKFRWPEPFIVALRNHMAGRSIDAPLPTITAGATHLALCEPFIMPQRSDHDPGRNVGAPLPTVTTVARLGVVEPFVVSTRQHSGGPAPRATDMPLPTLTATDSRVALVEPFVFPLNQSRGRARGLRSTVDPLCTITATGTDLGIVAPVAATTAHVDAAAPFILSRHAGGAPRAVDQPTPCQVAKHSHVLIAPYYGQGSGETCRSADDPLATITTLARFGLVMPVTHSRGGNRARTVDQPLATITCAARGELAFITAAFGERAGQAPRVHDLADPCPTICAEGRVQLVEPGRTPGRAFDIRFRMLEPHELAAAMSFSDAEARYEFVGNKTEQTRQIGNAVPCRTAAALVTALMEA